MISPHEPLEGEEKQNVQLKRMPTVDREEGDGEPSLRATVIEHPWVKRGSGPPLT